MSIKTSKSKLSEHTYPENAPGQEITETQTPARNSFIENLLRLFREGYTTPHIYKAVLDTFLLLVLVSGIATLMALARIDEQVGAILLALIMGFIFGKIK